MEFLKCIQTTTVWDRVRAPTIVSLSMWTVSRVRAIVTWTTEPLRFEWVGSAPVLQRKARYDTLQFGCFTRVNEQCIHSQQQVLRAGSGAASTSTPSVYFLKFSYYLSSPTKIVKTATVYFCTLVSTCTGFHVDLLSTLSPPIPSATW
jgi:hypothetical protein